MSNKVTVVGAVLDERYLTLYVKGSAEQIRIPQGDPRVAHFVENYVPILNQGGEVEYSEEDLATHNVYADAEKKSGGIMRFFRVARKKVAEFFSSSSASEPAAPVAPVTAGAVPGDCAPDTDAGQGEVGEAEKVTIKDPVLAKAVDDILAHAVPSTAPQFSSSDLESLSDEGVEDEDEDEVQGDTIIAVTDQGTIVPDAHKLKTQLTAAVQSKAKGSTVGIENFLRRAGSVAAKRQHSVQDLMRFIERGDLPIADDGCIVIYKLLLKGGPDGHKEFSYRDIHSQKVPQGVSTLVCMNESLVDPDRRNECSNGLHVARRQYLGSFSGNVCVLAKVAPEDVIAVPSYDANKMRVRAYHILFELPDEAMRALKDNRSMTDIKEASRMLGAALSGQHSEPAYHVEITGHRGSSIVVHKGPGSTKNKVQTAVPKNAPEARSLPTTPSEVVGEKVDVLAVVDTVMTETKQPEPEAPSLTKDVPVAEPKPAKVEKKSKSRVPARKAKKLKSVKVEAKPVAQPVRDTFKAKGEPLPADKKTAMTLVEQGQVLWQAFVDSKGDKAKAQACLDFKKAKKKGWTVLGMPGDAADKLAKALK
ncbi:putative rIIB-like protein [Pseudomonas phage vB_PaeP_PS28]|nr:putative rIIB-like protein [Pseudomonas phage vB_PaeP_PS28]